MLLIVLQETLIEGPGQSPRVYTRSLASVEDNLEKALRHLAAFRRAFMQKHEASGAMLTHQLLSVSSLTGIVAEYVSPQVLRATGVAMVDSLPILVEDIP